jgi:phosphoglycolate phosphatase
LLIIFDLDGTLIDSSRDLAISTNATREHFGLVTLDAHIINSYVGNGAPTLIRRAMGTGSSDETVAQALKYFLQYYREHSLENTKLYAGVQETLSDLRRENHVLGVLTNKPSRITVDILAALHVDEMFERVFGGDTFPAKKPDPVGILQMARETSTPLTEVLMVGDSKVDIQTARNARVCSCGVTWGFQPETFAEVPPDITIHTPRELLEAIVPLTNGNRKEH